MPNEIKSLDVKLLKPSKLNPRRSIDTEGLEELADSIKEVGIVQPLLVRPISDGYEIVIGERRLRACKLAGIETVPAIVQNLTDEQVIELSLIENTQREDLNDVEKGKSCKELMYKFPKDYPTVNAIATRLGMSTTTVRTWISIADDVPAEIQDMIATQEKRSAPIPQGKLTSQIALQISRKVKKPKRQIQVAKAFAQEAIPVHKAREVIKAIVDRKEEPVEEIVKEVLETPPDLPFRLTHAISIINGTKTQTSRNLRPDDLKNLKQGVIVSANIWQPQFAKLRIKKIEKKRLNDFTEEDAKREGGYTLKEFKEVWETIHGNSSWEKNPEVNVIHFELIESDQKAREKLHHLDGEWFEN